MKKYIIILAILGFYNEIVFGQETHIEKTSQVKFTPTRMIDPVNPGFEFGFEKLHNQSLSSQITITYLTDVFQISQFDNFSGFIISFEEKLFTHSTKRKRKYFSVEPVYLKVNYSDVGIFIQDTALATPKYWDIFQVAKQTYSLNFKYGVQYYFNRFIIDAGIGLGIKYKIVKRSGLLNENAFQEGPRHPNVYFMASKGGDYFGLSVPLSIKIGYCF